MNPTQESFLFEVAQPSPLVTTLEVTNGATREWTTAGTMQRVESPLHPDHCRALEAALHSYNDSLGRLALTSSYYRYRGLTHTVRIRRDQLIVRISHHFQNEEPRTIEAVGHILFRKLLRRRQLKREWEIACEAERRLDAAAAKDNEDRPFRRISERHWAPPQGKVHDLERLTQSLSARFFEGAFPDLPLSWTAKKVKGYWGKYFAEPPRIVLNRKLDHPKVPDYVVEAVLYHEMLHHHLGIEKKNGRRRIHTKEFREAELRYPRVGEAERFLEEFPKRTRRWL